jgi:hypothetical protein
VQAGETKILEASERADELLSCLRGKASESGIGIDERQDDETRSVHVADTGGAASGELAEFLRAQLDECARELGVGWHEYPAVSEPRGRRRVRFVTC